MASEDQDNTSQSNPARRSWGWVQDRYLLWFCALATLLCTLIAPRLDPQGWEQRRWAFLGDRALDGLLEQAQVPLQAPEPSQRLSLALQGMKLQEAQARGLREAMARHPGVNERPGSAHRLLASAHTWGPIAAVELRLFRRGWVLRVQEIERMIHAPWLPALALLLSALVCLGPCSRWVPGWLTLPLAAAGAQAMLAWMRKGEPYREIPVRWTEWPQKEYAWAMQAWGDLLASSPKLSCGVACALLLLAVYISHRASLRGHRRSGLEIAVLILWILSSLVWWDAAFRCTLPLTAIEGPGASLMRCSHALRGVAWGCTALMIWRACSGTLEDRSSDTKVTSNPDSAQSGPK